ncbi:MAG TPA: ATP-binding protein [Verrucomicrobiae bacterium]|nr:ATP-binding protein [Verrucomicrobiae bacterium]
MIFSTATGYSQKTVHPASPDADEVTAIIEATNHIGEWIWDSKAFDKQTCRLWKSFAIPAGMTVSNAILYITVDNSYRLFLDDREIGRGSDWRTITQYDLKWLLRPGKHSLAVEGFNDRLSGGLIFGLKITLANGNVIQILSDPTWKIVPLDAKKWIGATSPSPDWHSAIVVGGLGTPPWDKWPYAVLSEPPLQPIIRHFWQSAWFQVSVLAVFAFVLVLCLWLMIQLIGQSKASRLLQLQRARIARDIHDDLGARLTQLVLLGELAQSELPTQSETRAQIDQICEQARSLSNAMSEVVWAVSSRRDTLRDFAAYVCRYAQLFLKDTPIRCRLDVEPELPSLAFDLAGRRNLLLAVKEAISNAAKHSGANEIFLRIHHDGKDLRVVVEDNGTGFDLATADNTRNGLTNMAQRMWEVGGRFSINTAPGMGCRIQFELPLTQTRHRLGWFGRFLKDATNEPELTALAAREMETTEN